MECGKGPEGRILKFFSSLAPSISCPHFKAQARLSLVIFSQHGVIAMSSNVKAQYSEIWVFIDKMRVVELRSRSLSDNSNLEKMADF